MEETWKNVTGFENFYQVSNIGRVRSKDREYKCLANGKYPCTKILHGRVMRERIWKKRNQVAFMIGGERIEFWVHRLVAEAFISNPLKLSDVNHKDGNPLNNNVSNLEWATRSQNMQHAHDTGLIKMRKGSNHPKSKLTERKVKAIRKKRANGLTCAEIAKQYGVIQQTISEICLNHIWKHVK